jgi:hypothetical protein
MSDGGWQIIFLVALTMLDATFAFAGCRLLGLRRDLVMSASCDSHFHMNSGRRKVLWLGAGLLPAVAAGNPKEAWAQRSFDEVRCCVGMVGGLFYTFDITGESL